MQGFWVQSLVRELRCYELWGQKPKHKKQKQYCNKFNTDFKNGPFFKNLKKTPQLPHWVIVRIKWVNKYKHLLSTGHRVVFVWLYLLIYFFSSSRFVALPWWLRWWRICLQCRRPGFDSWVGKIPWRREWQPTPVFLPGEFHERRNLEGYSPWGHKEPDTTEWLTQIRFIGSVNIGGVDENVSLSTHRSH